MVTQAQLRQVQAQRFNIPRSQNVSAPFTAPTNTPKTGVPNTTPSSTSTVKKKGDLLDAPLTTTERLALERNRKLTPDKFPTTAEYKLLEEKVKKGTISSQRPNVSTPSELERFRSASFILNARTERLSKQLATLDPNVKSQELFESLPTTQKKAVSTRIDKTSFSGADRQDNRQTQVQKERQDDFGGLSGGFSQRSAGLQREGIFIREKGQTAFEAGQSQGKNLPRGSVEAVRTRFDTRTNLSTRNIQEQNERSSVRVLSGSGSILDTGASRSVEAKQVGVQESMFTGGQGRIEPTPDFERPLRIFGIKTPFKEPNNLLRRSEEIAIAARREEARTGEESKTGKFLAFSTGVFEGLVVAPIARTGDVLKGFVTVLTTDPRKTFKIIKEDIRTAPESSGGQLIGSLALGKGVVKGTGGIVRGLRAGTTALDVNFRPAIPGEITGSQAISTITVETSAGPKTIQVSGAIGSKSLPNEPLPIATARAGTKVDAISAARDLFKPIEFAKEVNKPLPDPKASLLEKSFFLDPETRLRPSRLGLTQTSRPATIQDLATGDFSVLPQKPQAILIPELAVQKFPKSLSDIEVSLRTGKTLTPAQQQRLLNFQLQPSGQAKPVGFLSTEPEVTLAPGEVIVRVGNSQQTLLPKKGKFFPEPVEIIEAQVLQTDKVPKGSTVLGGDLDSLPSGIRISRLPVDSPRLRVESSISYGFAGKSKLQPNILSSDTKTSSEFKPTSPVSPRIPQSPRFFPSQLTTSKTPSRPSTTTRTPSRTVTSDFKSPNIVESTSPISITPRVSSPVAPSPISPPKIISPPTTTTQDKTFTPTTLSTKQKKQLAVKAFDVFLKSKGEFKKVASGLPRGLALRAGRSAALGSLAATFKLRERGTTTRRDIAFDKKQLGDVFREYKIRQGQKVITPDTFIQRRGKRLKTSKERSLIQRARKKSSSKGFFGKPSGGLL